MIASDADKENAGPARAPKTRGGLKARDANKLDVPSVDLASKVRMGGRPLSDVAEPREGSNIRASKEPPG